jgi:hypothetical protein
LISINTTGLLQIDQCREGVTSIVACAREFRRSWPATFRALVERALLQQASQ